MLFRTVLEIDVKMEGNSFDQIEKDVKSKSFMAAQELIKQILCAYERAWLDEHLGARHKGVAPGRFVSSFGEFDLERTKVNYRGKYFYPIDQWMGLVKHRRQTPEFQNVLKEEFIDRTFRKGVKAIHETTDVKLSAYSGWEAFQDIAEKEKRQTNTPALLKNLPLKRLRPNEENRCPVLCIEQDGTYCRAQPITRKDHDVKLAILYTAKEIKGRKWKREKLLKKTVVSSRKGEGIDSFSARVAWIAREIYGANENTCVVLRGDGDPWILRLKYDYFTNAHYFLDWWHVKKKLCQTLGYPIGEKLMKFIYARNPDGLLQKLDADYLSGSDPKLFDAVQALYTYIENNREGLLLSGIHSSFKRQHPGMFKRGSGAMERNIDLVIGERCKLKRMRWSEKGLDNMIFLREHKINRENRSPVLRYAC